MTEIYYGITEETYSLGNEKRVSYGIAVYADPKEEITNTIIDSVRDISSDKERVLELTQRCNDLKLSLLHFHDVITDFLVS